MTQHKIIFSGPVGAGKTTAISSISDIPTVRTEKLATDETKNVKPNTTVAMDYGAIHLGDETVHLYGTPGQDRFDFMWDILSQGAIGLVLVISNTRPEPYADLQRFLDAFRPFAEQMRLVIGVSQTDLKPHPSVDDYQQRLIKQGLKIPVFEIDARDRSDVSLLIQALLLCVDPGVEVEA